MIAFLIVAILCRASCSNVVAKRGSLDIRVEPAGLLSIDDGRCGGIDSCIKGSHDSANILFVASGAKQQQVAIVELTTSGNFSVRHALHVVDIPKKHSLSALPFLSRDRPRESPPVVTPESQM